MRHTWIYITGGKAPISMLKQEGEPTLFTQIHVKSQMFNITSSEPEKRCYDIKLSI
jgi:hypothetical protein